jgi:cystathionine beta-lyase
LSPETARRTITLLAPSKTFNIPGLGCSFAVIPDRALRHAFRKTMAGIVPHVNALGYAAALAAYRDGEEWRRALIDYLRANLDLVTEAVGMMPGLSMTPVEATYLAWIDTRLSGIAHPARFFEEAGVGLSDGKEFDGAGFVRLNFGCPRTLLAEALDRMKRALARRGGPS